MKKRRVSECLGSGSRLQSLEVPSAVTLVSCTGVKPLTLNCSSGGGMLKGEAHPAGC